MLQRKVLEGFGQELGWLGASPGALAAKEGAGDTFFSHGSLSCAANSGT